VFSQRGLQAALGLSQGGGKSGARRIVEFMLSISSKGIDDRGLAVRADSPIRFVLPRGGVSDGYEATILPDICAVIIDAHHIDRFSGARSPSTPRVVQRHTPP